MGERVVEEPGTVALAVSAARAATADRSRRFVRLGWGVADQALSSLANLGLGAMVARAVSPDDFGAFGLAFSTYLITLGVCRALVSEPLVVRFSAVRQEEWRAASRAATGTALLVGVAVGAGCASAGLLIGGLFGRVLLTLAPLLPALLVQDTWRYAFFAEARGRRAFANDLAWSATLLPALALLDRGGAHSASAFVLVWGLSGLFAAAVGSAQAGSAPDPRAAPAWLRGHADLSVPYLGEFAALGAGELALFGIGGLVGLASVGALRAGQILLGPLRVLSLGVRLVAVPEGVRGLRAGVARTERPAVILSVAVTAVALAWGAVLLLLPASVGTALLGQSWTEARSVIVPLTLAMAGTGATTGAFVGLRALGAARRSLCVRVAIAPLMVAASIGGAVVCGAPGAAWGMAAVVWLSVGLWWRQFGVALRERFPASP
jgi:O-antigen/teichoic acid export membrane protein